MARRGDRFAAPVPGDIDEPTSWRSLVDAYLLSLELKALSPATVYGRRKALASLAGWSIDRDVMSPAQVSVEVVDAYRRHLHRHLTKAGTPLTVRSQQQYLIAARGLFAWLTKQRHIVINPTAEMELPKTPERLPRHRLDCRSRRESRGFPRRHVCSQPTVPCANRCKTDNYAREQSAGD